MKKIVIGLGALAALAFAAIAQPLVQQNLSGNEVLNVEIGGPGGGGIFTSVNALRNATGYLIVGFGSTVNTIVPATASKVIPNGAITTWNITLPTSPYDGQTVAVACPAATATTVTVSATLPASVTIVGTAFTTCVAGGAAANTAEWIYSTSANIWYRIQ